MGTFPFRHGEAAGQLSFRDNLILTQLSTAMPPRLLATRAAASCRAAVTKNDVNSLTSCLAGMQLHQTRSASILGSLANTKGAIHHKKRVGRGPSSGHGKTSGRGHKGQKQHGKVNPWFQGGQTPLVVKHGTKGFTNLYVFLSTILHANESETQYQKSMFNQTLTN